MRKSSSCRRQRTGRGLVLILVVALLVLMALIGTAWLSTVRVDRASAYQHSFNTQIDLLVDGVVNMALAGIVGDVAPGDQYRTIEPVPTVSPAPAGNGSPQERSRANPYQHWDDLLSNDLLSSRVPVLTDDVAPVWQDQVNYRQGRLVRNTSGALFLASVDHKSNGDPPPSPRWIAVGELSGRPIWPALSSIVSDRLSPPFEDLRGNVPPFSQRTLMFPDVVQVGRNWFPGFRFFHPGLGRTLHGSTLPTGAPDPDEEVVIAGDADGDGMADSLLFRLPVGRINGLDYFAAVRIVDNNSAVNLSSAWQPNQFFYRGQEYNYGNFPGARINGATVQLAGEFFPTNVNLRGLLYNDGVYHPPEGNSQFKQMAGLNRIRMADAQDVSRLRGGDGLNPREPIYNYGNWPVNDQLFVYWQRQDYRFLSPYELLWTRLASRLDNPGWWWQQLRTGGGQIRQMAPPAVTEAGVLAYKGGTLVMPDSVGMTRVDQALHESIHDTIPNAIPGSVMFNASQYPHATYTDVLNWFNWNFHYRSTSMQMPFIGSTAEHPNEPTAYRNRRALLTTRNPVSNAAPNRNGFSDVGQAPDWRRDVHYAFGDRVIYNNLEYVCVAPFIRAGPGILPPIHGMNGQSHSGEADPYVGAAAGTLPPNWRVVPRRQQFTKASVNTADFLELWIAYWNVMAEDRREPDTSNPDGGFRTPFSELDDFLQSLVPGGFVYSPYLGNGHDGGFGLYDRGIEDGVFWDAAVVGNVLHPLRMFRSPVRRIPPPSGEFNATANLAPDRVMMLRAALAAVNTIDLRDIDDTVTVKDVNLGPVRFESGSQEVVARVFGLEAQPYITEVYASDDRVSTLHTPAGPVKNPTGYIAIELHNPYPFPIDVRNCRLATIDRHPSNTNVLQQRLMVVDHEVATGAEGVSLALALANSNMASGTPQTAPTVIPPKGYLVLENFRPADSTATEHPAGRAALARPAGTGLIPGVTTGTMAVDVNGRVGPAATGGGAPLTFNFAYVPNLDALFDREFTLVRPLNAQRTAVQYNGVNATGGLVYAPSAAAMRAVDMAPLDSFDLTGLPNNNSPPPGQAQAYTWHYARASDTTSNKAWHFVYPGRYDGIWGSISRVSRHHGVQRASWLPPQVDPWNPAVPPPGSGLPANPDARPPARAPSLGSGRAPGNAPGTADATYPQEFTIRLSNMNFGGPVPTMTPGVFPNGTFRRNGDILQVPYIGSYRLQAANLLNSTQVVELNAVTMDSIFAEDTDNTAYPADRLASNNPELWDPLSARNQEFWLPFFRRPANQPLAPQNIIDITNPIRREQIGRFCPSIADLMVCLTGTAVAGPGHSFNELVLDRSGFERPEPIDESPYRPFFGLVHFRNSGLVGWEITITGGPGAGQKRIIREWSQRSGRIMVLRPWSLPHPGDGSKYVLRPPSSYRWASDLFDYLTVQSPKDDQLPAFNPQTYGNENGNPAPPQAVSNVDPGCRPGATYGRIRQITGPIVNGSANIFTDRPNLYAGAIAVMLSGNAAGQTRVVVRSGGNQFITGPLPGTDMSAGFSGAARGDLFKIVDGSEDTVGVEGLININTAPAAVMATIPFVPPGQDTIHYNAHLDRLELGGTSPSIDDNEDIARAITRWRDGDPAAGIPGRGPFKTIFDLYAVPAFLGVQQKLLSELADGAGQLDAVHNDFEEHFLLLTRISNLITTRSDTFTCYVLVQGWRNVGTPEPELVVQRRRALMVDRTGVTARNRKVSRQYFYND